MPNESNKWIHVFTAGKYPQGDVTVADLKKIAACYDPVNLHEAFMTIGHIDWSERVGADEPPAIAWIKELKVEGDKLFALIGEQTKEFKEKCIDNKNFKRVSIELMPKDISGFEIDSPSYFYSMAALNRPAVAGLKPLPYGKHKVFIPSQNGVAFEIDFSENNNSNEMNISASVLSFAQSLGISIVDFHCDEDVLKYAADEIGKLLSKFEPGTVTSLTVLVDKGMQMYDKVVELTNANSAFETKVKQFEIEAEVNAGITAGKILPTQKDAVILFGQKSSAEDLKTYISKLPKISIFEKNIIKKDGADLGDDPDNAALKNPDGSQRTFAQYCAMLKSTKPEDKEIVASLKKNDNYKKLSGYNG